MNIFCSPVSAYSSNNDKRARKYKKKHKKYDGHGTYQAETSSEHPGARSASGGSMPYRDARYADMAPKYVHIFSSRLLLSVTNVLLSLPLCAGTGRSFLPAVRRTISAPPLNTNGHLRTIILERKFILLIIKQSKRQKNFGFIIAGSCQMLQSPVFNCFSINKF